VTRGVLVAIALLAAGCNDNMLSGNLKPVPPVHRVPIEIEGRTILVGEDAIIESSDPVHLKRAKERRIPQDFRASMTAALALAGFKVVSTASEPHDLVAKLALAVKEDGKHVYQTYRCGLRSPAGELVAQIDWAWPQGTFVEVDEVFDYATHHVATEIAMSPQVQGYLAGVRRGADAGP
jgi:hypothetical protein